MKSLYKMCARHSLVPTSLQIELCYNPADIPHSRGGFADVWKSEYRGREVAVKVLRISTTSDLQKVTHVSRRRRSVGVLVDILTVVRVGILQGIHHVESSSSSERAAAAGSDNDRESVRHGVRVDDKREHQPVCYGPSGCESVRAR